MGIRNNKKNPHPCQDSRMKEKYFKRLSMMSKKF